MKKNDITNNILDGVDSTVNVLSLINPALACITIITYAIKQVVNYTSSKYIVNRINKIEKELNNKKINIEDFKNKLLNLSEHNIYVAKNHLNNILLTCIPETVELYISVWIDLIMSEDSSEYEELCEILNELNKHDLVLLEMIKGFIKYGEKRFYISSEIENKIKRNKEREDNEAARCYNEKTKGIKKLEINIENSKRDIRFGEKTIFWKDFSNYYRLKAHEMGLLILDTCIKGDNQSCMDWAYHVRSFIKLDKLGIIQLDYINTIGTVNSLNIDRFHITLFGDKLLEYIPLKELIDY